MKKFCRNGLPHEPHHYAGHTVPGEPLVAHHQGMSACCKFCADSLFPWELALEIRPSRGGSPCCSPPLNIAAAKLCLHRNFENTQTIQTMTEVDSPHYDFPGK